MIDLLRQQHSAKDWLRVTSGTSRLELRVDKIESDGLHGFRARKHTPLPSMLPWSSIQRIDRRVSRFRTGQVLGLALGAIAGSYVGTAIANMGNTPPIYRWEADGTLALDSPGVTSQPGRGALIGLAVGGTAFAWLGGKLGDGIAHERPIYLASPSGSPSEPVATTPSEIAAMTPAPAEAWVAKVRARIKPGDLLRVTGSFGQFSGRAAAIGEQGLSGLQQDRALDSTLPLPSEPLSWATITRVDRRVNNSGRFAMFGGIGLGVFTGFMAAGIHSTLSVGASTGDVAPSFAGGFVLGGLAGTGIGALIGLAVPRWNLVYRQPRSQPVASMVH